MTDVTPPTPPPTKPIPDIPDQPEPTPMPGDPPSGERMWPPPAITVGAADAATLD